MTGEIALGADALITALQPILSRVRLDVSAVKVADGTSRWTSDKLTRERMTRHLTGGPARGVCPIKAGESTTRLALLDLDSHGGETTWEEMCEVASRIIDTLALDGYYGTPWRSSGGRGIHIYMLWDEPQDAYSVRTAIMDVLALLGFKNGAKGVKHGQIEVFPKQDEVLEGEFGNQFILPLSGASVPLSADMTPLERDAACRVQWAMSEPVPVRERPVVEHREVSDSEEVQRVRQALMAIPNDSVEVGPDYDEWRDIVFAVHEATGGSDDGYHILVEWSAQNPKFDEQFFTKRVWPYVKNDGRGCSITRATLYAKAGQHGWVDAVGMDAEGFDDVPQEVIEQANAVIAQTQASVLIQRREALAKLVEKIAASEDTIHLKATVAPIARKLLSAYQDLRSDVVAAFKLRAKELDSPLSAADITRLLTNQHKPTVKQERPLTEFGNAERMLDRYGPGLMYVPEIEAWFIWTGVYWRKASDVELQHCAKETVRELVNESKEVPADQLGEFFEFCRQSQRAVMVKNMVSLAASDPRVVVPASELDKHPHFLGVKNGVVDLRTGRLLPPDPDLHITIIAGCDYDPAAKCPLFEQTLNDVFFGDADMADYVMRAFGYALTGAPTEDIMFIAFGNGSNGKSTIFNAVRKAFGSYARSADASSFISDGQSGGAGGAREDLVRLRGARFVYVNEPDENGELREGVVKSMTGGDAITARGLYAKESVEIEPTWTVFMPTNHKPIIKGNDNGIWRRMGLIPFERNFEKDQTVAKDTRRAEKLEAEMPGILTLLVRSAMRYQRVGLTPPAKVLRARDAYRSEMDLLAEWVEECCEVADGLSAPTKDLWLSWEQFAKTRGLLNYVKTISSFSRRLDTRFPGAKGSGGVRVRLGLRLRSPNELF